MATSITSAGIVFPDSTVQTTAAGAGGSSLEAVASGSLSNGDMVIVNTDGTVSVVAATSVPTSAGTPALIDGNTGMAYGAATYDSVNQKVVAAYLDQTISQGVAVVGTVSGTSISWGSSVTFYAGTTSYVSMDYDPTSGKLIIAATISGGYGYAWVGTVSGTSISFGSDNYFASSATFIAVRRISGTGKFVIAYRNPDLSNYGTALVATISGTTLSFGSTADYNTAGTYYNSIAYDSVNDKVVISYRNVGNSNYGTAIVGTVSGTSISFGTAVVFSSAGSTNYMSSTYDSTNQKIVIAFQTTGGTKAIVGTVSGTSVSFGTAASISAANSSFISCAYDSTNSNVVICYDDAASSYYGTVVVGTVSGTSISIGTAVVFQAATSLYIGATYDSNAQKVVTVYGTDGSNVYATAVVITPAYSSTNLTSENYIGVSDGNYSDAATATIQLLGSVDDAQSSLTPGQKYYVQNDGTISVTPGSPEVLAGTAVATTKLVIKR